MYVTALAVNVNLDNEIDGEAFMVLTEGDFKELLPGKLGAVKKLIILQKTVFYLCVCKYCPSFI